MNQQVLRCQRPVLGEAEYATREVLSQTHEVLLCPTQNVALLLDLECTLHGWWLGYMFNPEIVHNTSKTTVLQKKKCGNFFDGKQI